MSERCANGNVAWISLESPFMVKWPTSVRSSEGAKTGATQVLVTLPGGTPSDWGWCHHHGLWTRLDVPAYAATSGSTDDYGASDRWCSRIVTRPRPAVMARKSRP